MLSIFTENCIKYVLPTVQVYFNYHYKLKILLIHLLNFFM